MIKKKGVTISQKLEKFLRKEKVYTKFCDAVNSPSQLYHDPEELTEIESSFIWDRTNDGWDFWNELSAKYFKNK